LISGKNLFQALLVALLIANPSATAVAKDDKPLVIAVSTGLQPFMGKDINGDPSGMLVDLWGLWSKKVDREIEFRLYDWPGSLEAVRTSEADIHAGMFESESRQGWLDFSRPIYEVSSSLYVRADGNLLDLSNSDKSLLLGTLAGSYHEERVSQKYPNINVVRFSTPESLVKALLDGSVAAVVSEGGSFRHLSNVYGARGKILHQISERWIDDIHAGFLSTRSDIAELVDRGWRAVDANDYKKVEERWLDKDVAVNFRLKGRPLSLTPSEEAWLNKQDAITVGIMKNWVPFSFKSEAGQRVGISASVFNHINKHFGNKLILKPGEWKTLLNEVETGKLDAVLDITPSTKREPLYFFTTPYLETRHAIFGKKVKGLSFAYPDISSATIALERGFGNVHYYRDLYSDIKIIEVADTLAALQYVAEGKAEYYIGNKIVGMFAAKKGGIDNLVTPIASAKRPPIPLNIGVRKDARILRDIFQKAIDTITPEQMNNIVASAVGGESTTTFTISDEERAWLNTKQKVRIFIGSWQPYFYMEDGQPKGLGYEYVRHILTALGVDFETRHMTWAEGIENIRSLQKVDLLPTAAYSEERAKYLNFTPEYTSSPMVIVSRKNGSVITGLDDLKGMVISVENEFIMHQRLRVEQPDLQLATYPTTSNALEAVSLGQADAYVGNLAAAGYLIEKLGFGNLKIAAPAGYDVNSWAIAVRKDWPELTSLMSKYLAQMSDEEHGKLRQAALTVRFEHGIDWWTVVYWMVGITAIFSGAITIIVYWNRRLGNEVRERKIAQADLSDALKIVNDSINYASRIQRSVLPDETLFSALFKDHFILWDPRDVVGGDIYWANMWGNGVVIVLGDCTGHGVPGAFMTLITTGAMERALIETKEGKVGEFLQQIHQMVQVTLGQHGRDGESDDGMELGVCYFEPKGKSMHFASARFDLFIVEDGEVKIIKSTKSGVGYRGIPFDQTFEKHQIDLTENQSIYMTSDGLIDQVGGERARTYGKKRFKDLLLSVQDMPMSEQKEAIYQALVDYQGDQRRRDDVAVVGFRV